MNESETIGTNFGRHRRSSLVERKNTTGDNHFVLSHRSFTDRVHTITVRVGTLSLPTRTRSLNFPNWNFLSSTKSSVIVQTPSTREIDQNCWYSLKTRNWRTRISFRAEKSIRWILIDPRIARSQPRAFSRPVARCFLSTGRLVAGVAYLIKLRMKTNWILVRFSAGERKGEMEKVKKLSSGNESKRRSFSRSSFGPRVRRGFPRAFLPVFSLNRTRTHGIENSVARSR